MLALLAASPAAQAANSAQVGVDAAGNATFVWRHWNGSHYVAQTRTRSASGVLSATQTLSSPDVDAETPQLAVDPAGNATFVWTRWNGVNRIVQTRTRSAAGALTAIQDLSVDNRYPDRMAQVAVDGNGNATFVWRESEGWIHARRRSANGTLGDVVLVTPSKTDAPQLAVDSAGTVTFVWVNWYGYGTPYVIQTRTWTKAGVLTPVYGVSAQGQNPQGPQMAVAPAGDATFTWQRQLPDFYTVQTRTRSAAGTFSAFQALSAGGQHAGQQQVGVDANGNAVFAWRRSNGTNLIVQARARSADGTLSAIQDLSAAGQHAHAPQLAVDPDGDAAFTWQRWNGSNFIVQARVRSAAGGLSTVQNLSGSGGNATGQQVAVDADGDATFVWERYNGSAWVIQTRTRSPAGTLSPTQSLTPLT
jgi:hypothetical protein